MIGHLNAFSAPYYFYPKNYVITIENANRNDIKSVEVLYSTGVGFNYESNSRFRYWLKNTNFGYKYRQYSDEEIIPKLSEEQIDEIAFLYVHQDASSRKGYWLDSSVVDINTSIAKFAKYESANIKYQKDKIIISYSTDEKKRFHPDGMLLRVAKKDGSVLYSNKIYSSKVGLIDEFSKKEDIEKAKRITTLTVSFESDFSCIGNKFKVVENN